MLCIIRLPHFPSGEPITFYNVGTAFAHIVLCCCPVKICHVLVFVIIVASSILLCYPKEP